MFSKIKKIFSNLIKKNNVFISKVTTNGGNIYCYDVEGRKKYISGITNDVFINDKKIEFIKGNGNLVKEKRELGHFDELNCTLDANVFFGKEQHIEIEADSNILDFVKIYIKDNTLNIFAEGCFSLKNKITVNCYLKEKLPVINLKGSSNLNLNNIIQDELEINLKGSSTLISQGVIKNLNAKIEGSGEFFAEKLNVKNKSNLLIKGTCKAFICCSKQNELNIEIHGSSYAKIFGIVEKLNAKNFGSGNLDAKNLKTLKSDLEASNNGHIKVTCTESLIARTKNAADIIVYGNPQQKNIKESGVSEVTLL